jgi:hypothetical protein
MAQKPVLRAEVYARALRASQDVKIFTLPHCTSDEFFFFCYGSIAALPALANFKSTWPKQTFRDRTRPHPARFGRRPQLGKSEW